MRLEYLLKAVRWRAHNMRLHGLIWLYFYDLYARKILNTKPIISGADKQFELHTLTCEKDLVNTLWALKSFYHFSGVEPRLVIYEDGSLSRRDLHRLSEHCRNSQIIRRAQFYDEMESFLAAYPMSLKYSRREDFYCALKLFGPMVYKKSDQVLYIDSDVLFFQRPSEMLDCIRAGIPFFMSDYQNAYSQPVAFLENLLNIKLTHKINAGMHHFAHREVATDLALVESYFRAASVFEDKSLTVNRHEQTLVAMLLSKANAVRLGNAYQISKTPITAKTVSHHFVNDGSRATFYTAGLRWLRSSGFISVLSKGR